MSKQSKVVAPPSRTSTATKSNPLHPGDPTKRGVRKIFVAFFVDLTHIIPYATTSAPQQREMIQEAMLAADNSSWLGQLPAEPINIISSRNGGTMSGGEAEAYSLELMDKRTAYVEESDSNYFGQVFNVWYVLAPSYSLLEGITKVLHISEHWPVIHSSQTYILNPVRYSVHKSQAWQFSSVNQRSRTHHFKD